jgi:3-phosphoglycerate kinase
MQTIDNFNFAGKKAIVRVDFNVPLDENGKITDDTRIRGALPTLKKILADGGSVIIMSHMGKPKGKVNAKYSLSQIVDAVAEKLGVKVNFADDCAKTTKYDTMGDQIKNFEKQIRGACQQTITIVQQERFDWHNYNICSPESFKCITLYKDRDLDVLKLSAGIIIFYNSLIGEN